MHTLTSLPLSPSHHTHPPFNYTLSHHHITLTPSPSLHTHSPPPHHITLTTHHYTPTTSPSLPPSHLPLPQGFKIQDTRDISPWDVIEGIKNFGPLNLSWFGAVRMERRVPKYEVQTKLIQCHAHKKNAVGHSFVQFADPAEVGGVLGLQWKCC